MKYHVDTTILELAYVYLAKKQQKTHKQYTIADVLTVVEKILRWSEQKNRFEKENKLQFAGGHLQIDEKYVKKDF